MIMNDTSGNLYSIEQTCRDICVITNNMCTVFAVYDMCKDELRNYPGLTRKMEKGRDYTELVGGRGEGEETVAGRPYWHIAGAESLGTVKAESILADEILERLRIKGVHRTIEFPDVWTDFRHGNLGYAIGAASFTMKWYQERVDLEEETFFYTPVEYSATLGDRENRQTKVLEETETDFEDSCADYSGEWLVGSETRQGWGTLVRTNG